MASSSKKGKSPSFLNSGGELTANSFRDVADELRNVILILEEAGLTFILEHPCTVLTADVLEFFKNMKVHKENQKLKSKVRSLRIQVTPDILTENLKFPVVGEEDDISDENYHFASSFCGLSSLSYSARRKDMNEEGKLISDIVGKVLLCKVGSHDFLSKDMFKLVTAIICRKKVDWGSVLFSKIKDCKEKPNFGRIISLLLHQLHPKVFDLSIGTPIHHQKRIDARTLSKWERVIVKAPSKSKAPADAPSEEYDMELEPILPEQRVLPASRVEGEPSETLQSPVRTSTFQHPEILPSPVRETSMLLTENVPSPIREPLDIPPSSLPGQAPSQGEPQLLVSETAQVPPSSLQDTPTAMDQDPQVQLILPQAETEIATSVEIQNLVSQDTPLRDPDEVTATAPKIIYLPWYPITTVPAPPTSPPIPVATGSHSSSFETNPELRSLHEEVSSRTNLPSLQDPSLLQCLGALFADQRNHFDKSIQGVHARIDRVERDITSTRFDIQDLATKVDTWLVQGGKAVDHCVKVVAHLHSSLADMQAENRLMVHTVDNFMTHVENQLAKNRTLLSEQQADQNLKAKDQILEEVRKGETSTLNRLDSLDYDLKERIHGTAFELKGDIQNINSYTYESLSWLYEELSRSNTVPPAPSQVQSADITFPADTYEQVWADTDPIPTVSNVPSTSVTITPPPIRMTGQPPSKRPRSENVPSSSRSAPPVRDWSPVSRQIILDTLRLVEGGAPYQEFYSRKEWKQYEDSMTKRRIHFRTYSNLPNPPNPPPKYHPKPNAYFIRQNSKAMVGRDPQSQEKSQSDSIKGKGK